MSFTGLDLQFRYRTGDNTALPHDFYSKVLPYTKQYNRAVGFFSSSSFVELADGIKSLISNHGKMKLITSPRLNKDDIEAIEKGYRARNDVYLNALQREMKIPESIEESNKLNILAEMIETGLLEIKIAVTKNPTTSMYHEKIGLFVDDENNTIAISGSNNESENAISENFESFDVFCGWKQSEEERVNIRKTDFNDLWDDKQENLEVFYFPDFPKAFIQSYKIKEVYSSKKEKDSNLIISDHNTDFAETEKEKNFPQMPKWLKLHNYQEDAINEWIQQKHIGIYDMATGTGKTLTALSSVVKLFETNNDICTIIICPYIHLVTQWVEDIVEFNIKPIIGFGASPQKNWKDRFERATFKRNYKDGADGYFCFVTTVATFKSEYVQQRLKKIKKDILLIADEAHNLGAQNAQKHLLPELYKYRLALSATLERHHDEKGTKVLYDFFGKKCIEYDLERAIREHYLVPYKYYPIIVTLDSEEREAYEELTKSITQEIVYDSKTKKNKLSERGKLLCILRSRIIAGCNEKIPSLMNAIKPYQKDNMILVYCGAVKYNEDNFDENDNDENTNKQIIEVCKRLHYDLGFSVTKFTAEETSEEREIIKKKFAEGKDLQVITAIKCLDEGVNIPSIKTAFILASSTNSKEYIQRRGRVLRTFEGKDFAEIYDFVTLPCDLDSIQNKTIEENHIFRGLAKNELARILEFSNLAMNRFESQSIIEKIRKAFNINDTEVLEEDLYE